MRAVDADEPSAGHKFFFSLAPEGTYRSNFTIRDNGGKKKKKLSKPVGSITNLALGSFFEPLRFYFQSFIMWFMMKQFIKSVGVYYYYYFETFSKSKLERRLP